MEAYTYTQFRDTVNAISCPQGYKKCVTLTIPALKAHHLIDLLAHTKIDNIAICVRWMSEKVCIVANETGSCTVQKLSDESTLFHGLTFRFISTEPIKQSEMRTPTQATYYVFDDVFFISAITKNGGLAYEATFHFDHLSMGHVRLLLFVADIKIPFITDDNRCLDEMLHEVFKLAPLRRPRAPLVADLAEDRLSQYVVARKDDGVRAYIVIRAKYVFLISNVTSFRPLVRLITILPDDESVNFETVIIDGELDESYMGVDAVLHFTISEVLYFNGETHLPRDKMIAITKHLQRLEYIPHHHPHLRRKWAVPYGPNVIGALIEYARDFPADFEGLVLTPKDETTGLPLLKWKNTITYDFMVKKRTLCTSAGTQFYNYSIPSRSYNGKIVECVFDASRNRFEVLRERPDKMFPNSAYVLNANMRADARDILDEREKLVITALNSMPADCIPNLLLANERHLVKDLDQFTLYSPVPFEDSVGDLSPGTIWEDQDELHYVVTKSRIVCFTPKHGVLVRDLVPGCEQLATGDDLVKFLRASFKLAPEQPKCPKFKTYVRRSVLE